MIPSGAQIKRGGAECLADVPTPQRPAVDLPGNPSSGTNSSDQGGARVDFNVSPKDQVFGRYSYARGYDINPISVRGTDVPGFPTRDDNDHSIRCGFFKYPYLLPKCHELTTRHVSALPFRL